MSFPLRGYLDWFLPKDRTGLGLLLSLQPSTGQDGALNNKQRQTPEQPKKGKKNPVYLSRIQTPDLLNTQPTNPEKNANAMPQILT